jgi:sugar O-acyltransferase (sialic acid O-acetyltransferase NeuD family)
MSRLIIVSAGGFGREVYGWVKQTPLFLEKHQIESVEFIDDNLDALEAWSHYPKVISRVQDYQPLASDVLICSIGSPAKRQEIVQKLQAKGGVFVGFAHHTALINEGVTLGTGSILCPYSVISCDATIGDYFILNVSSSVGHDVKVGNFVTFSAHCDATGGVVIGDYCMLGSSSRIIPGVTLGENVKVGAGSVVVRNVKANTSVFGVPAKNIPRRGV